MKRTLIALGVIAAAAAPLAAQANPKVYGRMNLSVENVDADTAASDVWRVHSNNSRFGVRGENELSPTLSAIYRIEWEVSGDGNGTDLAQRNRFVGLKSTDLGQLSLGRNDTFFKQAEGRVDLFNDLSVDMDNVVGAQAGPARANNVIEYTSPKIADALTANVQFLQYEGATITGSTEPDDGLADGISASLVYGSDMLNVALAVNKDVTSRFADSGGNGFKADGVRLAGTLNLKDIGLTLGALYQTIETSDVAADDTTEDGIVVSAALKLGESWTAKLLYGMSETENARNSNGTLKAANDRDVDRTLLNLGVDYSLAKNTKVFAFVSQQNRKSDAQDVDTDTYSIGLEHNF